MKFLKKIHNYYYIKQFNNRNKYQKINYDQSIIIKPSNPLKKERFSNSQYQFQEPLNNMDLMHGKYSMEHRILYDYIIDESFLSDSLSKLLDFFPQIGGNLVLGKNNEVLNDFSNSNIELVIVKTNDRYETCNLDQYMMKVPIQAPFSLHTPLFKVTLTHFEKEQKSLISIFHSHVILDGTSFSYLLENWSKILKNKNENWNSFFQGKDVYEYKNDELKMIDKYPMFYQYNKDIGHFLNDLVKRSFIINDEKIQNIKQRIKNTRNCDVSTNDILSMILYKAFSFTKDKNQEISLHMPVNGRKFFKKSTIPNHYIGNCMFHHKIKFKVDHIQNISLDHLIITFRDSISKLNSQHLYNFMNVLEYVKNEDRKYSEFINFPTLNLMNTLIITNVQMMNPFELNFGKGGPIEFLKPCYDIGRIHLIYRKRKDQLVMNCPLPKSESKIFYEKVEEYLY